jgi:hypothetical protein
MFAHFCYPVRFRFVDAAKVSVFPKVEPLSATDFHARLFKTFLRSVTGFQFENWHNPSGA